jgi:ubiquinone/menaquinone biosynthesis C-methylase UbiE
VGFYARHLLPRIINLAMRNKEITRLRAAWIPQARGDVLEIGIGSGLNLPFYTSEAKRVYGVEPSLELQRMARERAAGRPVDVEFLSRSAEDPIPLPNESVDTIVMTWTLCSISNPPKALEQMKRVLKRSGQLIFVEHGRPPDRRIAVWQDRLNPTWKRIGGGCNLNRKIDELIIEAGFQITDLRKFYLRGPRPMTYTYQGLAQVQ